MSEETGDQYFRTALESTSADFYIKAGNQYKISSCWLKAGDAFESAANLQDSSYVEASHLTKAAEGFIKVNPQRAQNCLETSIDLFASEGKFSTAAKNVELLATLLLNNGQAQNAVILYEKAYNYYNCETSSATASGCLLKAIDISLSLHDYDHALLNLILCYNYYIKTKLTSFKCKELLFQIALIKIYLDRTNIKDDLDLSNDETIKEYLALINAPTLDQLLELLNSHDSLTSYESELVSLIKDKMLPK